MNYTNAGATGFYVMAFSPYLELSLPRLL